MPCHIPHPSLPLTPCQLHAISFNCCENKWNASVQRRRVRGCEAADFGSQAAAANCLCVLLLLLTRSYPSGHPALFYLHYWTKPPSLRSFVYFIFCKLSLLCHGQSVVVVPKQRLSFELNPGIIGLAKCLTPSTTLHSQVRAAQLAPTRRRFSHCLCRRVSLSHFSFSLPV